MHAKFPLFQSHLDLAHSYWEKLLHKEAIAIDATCGNGHDTLFLSPLAKKLYAIDIQEKAIEKTREKTGNAPHIQLIQASHATFPLEIEKESVSLIVYNLGYLPDTDKSLTTIRDTTLESLENALPLLHLGGAISITCYPGHPEGALEEEAIATWSTKLSPSMWSVCHHQWKNRNRSPSLFLIQKKLA